VRLPATGPARFVKDLALHSLEGVLHDGTFHRRELAADRNRPIFRRADVEVTPLPESGISKFGLLLGSLGRDDTLALLPQLVERVFLRGVDQLPRRIWIRLDGRKKYRRLSWRDDTAS
jgi:hypothetical protein